jgi:hypothetical protein
VPILSGPTSGGLNNPYAPPAAPPKDEPAGPRTGRRLPYSGWWAIGGGAIAGILVRLIFWGDPGNAFGAMLGSFIFGAPVIVGAVTVYLAERIEPRSWLYHLFAPMLASALFVTGAMALLIEGWICAILIIPLFAVCGGLAGLLMGLICRLTRWPRRSIVSSVALLPLLGGAFEHRVPAEDRVHVETREILVAAPPAAVWRELVDVRDIRPKEVEDAWMYRIGVPLPLAGAADVVNGQHLRHITMGKGVRFDQVATVWRENEQVTWRYRFAPDSFPSGALDDHVRIGGQYFDIVESTYSLSPRGAGTVLTLSTRYRISTHFNWYAGWIGDFLVGDFGEKIVGFYASRAERAVAQVPAGS